MDDPNLPEGDFPALLAAAQSGAEWALAALWRSLHGPLLRFLRGLAGGAADDVESETWLRVARDLGRFEGDGRDFRAWVFAVARHRLVDARRHASRRPAVATPVEALAGIPADDDPAALALEALDTDAALALVGALAPDQAEVILLRVVAGLDMARVATIVGKRPGTVRVLQHRGLRRLAQLLAGLEAATSDEPVVR